MLGKAFRQNPRKTSFLKSELTQYWIEDLVTVRRLD